ncbi:MAG: gamma-glutamyltransferase, partial [Haliea sp.]|nr:gamma-glutamyltransferase [Haliea sp.]
MKLTRYLIVALGFCLVPVAMAQAPAPAAQTPIIDFGSRFLPTVARQGMVVGPEELAAEVGLD